VTVEGDTAYVVAHGSLLAFPLACQGVCHPTWTGTFVPGGAFAEGSPAPPGVGSGQVAIAGDDGTLWLFPATCPNPTCGPLRSFDLGAEGLGRPVIEEGFVFVASEDGRVFAIGTGCDPSNVTTCDEAATISLGGPTRAVPASGAGAVYMGDDAGTVHAFDLRASG
jgi:outer membrane protein assembly factor BamB